MGSFLIELWLTFLFLLPQTVATACLNPNTRDGHTRENSDSSYELRENIWDVGGSFSSSFKNWSHIKAGKSFDVCSDPLFAGYFLFCAKL